MADQFSQHWEALRSDVQAFDALLLKELNAAHQDFQCIVEGQVRLFERWQPESAGSLETLFSQVADDLLRGAIRLLRGAKPQSRALVALETRRADLEEAVSRLPDKLIVSGRAVSEAVAGDVGGRWRVLPYRLRRKPRSLPMRSIVGFALRAQMRRQAKHEGAFLLYLAQGILALLDPWQAARDEALRSIAWAGGDPEGLRAVRQTWERSCRRQQQRAEDALRCLRADLDQGLRNIARVLLSPPWRLSRETRRSAGRERYAECLAYWSRLRRAVDVQLDLDMQLAELGRQVGKAEDRALDSLEAEYHELLEELDELSERIQRVKGPQDQMDSAVIGAILPASERVEEWSDAISRLASERLPPMVEVVEPHSALPPWREPWRQLEPLQFFSRALAGGACDIALAGMQEAEAAHRSLVRRIERAREVILYSFEAASESGTGNRELLAEGRQNAQSVLDEARRRGRNVRPLVAKRLAEASASAFLECHVAIEHGRFGLLAHLARSGGRRSAELSRDFAVRHSRSAIRSIAWGVLQLYRWARVQVGWESAPEFGLQRVDERGYLGEQLEFDWRGARLPLIYGRLFRLKPLEDPRFLVGRKEEMQALARVRTLWDGGRAVSVLLIGARGSGKTSLLNCAVDRLFTDSTVVRGSFRERVQTCVEMDEFLRGLLNLSQDQDLRTALMSERRVIIIEEVERAFLRRMGGLEGLRRFLSLIADTSPVTLWVLAVNFTACKYLNAAVGIGQYFSHRLNVTSVSPQDLRKAILLRHNLSGLRLRFARRQARRQAVDRLRRAAGLQKRAADLFFEALYAQSGGVFRSAFHLWSRYIDRVDGGVLYLRDPTPPDFKPIADSLSREDIFTLQALLQHGSLEPEEHAAVFGRSADESRIHLERLADREVLEPEPGGRGWRVRPEAAFAVRTILEGENLL